MFTECVGRHTGNDEEEEVGVGITGRRPAGGEGGGGQTISEQGVHPSRAASCSITVKPLRKHPD